MSTKGSWQRPFDSDAWASNFERIFGKKAKPIKVTVPDDLPEEPQDITDETTP